jgi:3-dehydroquinate synthase
MSRHDFQIPVTFKHRVVFTRDAFSLENGELAAILREGGGRRALVLIEEAVAAAWPRLAGEIQAYLTRPDLEFRGLHILPGGEPVKADSTHVSGTWQAIDDAHLDRHSYLLAIGGGAFLDAIGFAAATAHRGVRLLRFPTTTLSQDDSGVGVKCAINAFGKKNWIGAFAVPFAVINDFRFLESQDEETKRAGLIEAVKVALVKDRGFFEWIETNLPALSRLEPDALETCIETSALLHAHHIAGGGDPFETGSSRPLDFGHWAAHKLEALTGYQLSHGQAVAVGLALDTLYSSRSGLAPAALADRVFSVLSGLQLATYHPALDWRDDAGNRRVLDGLDEFREHLGGELTVLMLSGIGQGVDVHRIDPEIVGLSIDHLRDGQLTSGETPHPGQAEAHKQIRRNKTSNGSCMPM